MIDIALIKTASSLCRGIYAYPGEAPVEWDHFEDDVVCWGIKQVNGVCYVVFRGSCTPLDWVLDAVTWIDPLRHAALGRVHPGFNFAIEAVWQNVKSIIGLSTPLVVTGHSLGAARADILTAYANLDGRSPIARIVFGEPKPGFRDFADIVNRSPGIAYCNGDNNGHDLVTDVPFDFPPEEYERPLPLVRVSISPPPADKWGMFRYHHMRLYDAFFRTTE